MTNHTPTPWELGTNGRITQPTRDGLTTSVIAVVQGYEDQVKGDSEFIVRAVNAYEKDQEIKRELLKALKWATRELEEAWDEEIPQLRQAIAKAETV
jgi:hypothetical protein